MGKRTKTIILGSPGEYARTLEVASARRAYPLSALAAVFVGAAFWTFTKSYSLYITAALALLGLFVYSVSQPHHKKRQQARIGRLNEEKVARILRRCGANLVAHGKVIGRGGDCDHIVAGSCLVAVETKTGSGKVSYSDGKLIAGRRVIPGDPVAQVTRQRENLSRVVNKNATGIVVVVDMKNRPFKTPGGVIVLSAADLRAHLASCPQVLTYAEVQRLADYLSSTA